MNNESKTILFIEELGDNRPERWYQTLPLKNIEVKVAENPEKARELLKSGNIDIIVMGMGYKPTEARSDVETGFSLLQEIRAHPTYKGTPIIVWTAFLAEGNYKKKFEELHIRDILKKRTVPSELSYVISNYL